MTRLLTVPRLLLAIIALVGIAWAWSGPIAAARQPCGLLDRWVGDSGCIAAISVSDLRVVGVGEGATLAFDGDDSRLVLAARQVGQNEASPVLIRLALGEGREEERLALPVDATGLSLWLSPDAERMLTRSGRTLTLWDRNATELASFMDPARGSTIGFTSDGSAIDIGCCQRRSARDGALLPPSSIQRGLRGRWFAENSDGAYMVRRTGRALQVVRLSDGTIERTLALQEGSFSPGPITELKLSPDDAFVVALYNGYLPGRPPGGSALAVWRIDDGTLVDTIALPAQLGQRFHLAWSPSGSRVALLNCMVGDCAQGLTVQVFGLGGV